MDIANKTGSLDFKYLESAAGSELQWESHCHICFEMIVVFEGEISIVIEGRRFLCSSDCIAIFPPLVYHSVKANPKASYHRITLLFDHSEIPSQIEKQLSERLTLDPIIDIPYLSTQISGIKKIFTSPSPEYYEPLAHAFMTEIFYAALEKTASEPSQVDEVLSRMLSYIDAHICEQITINDISEAIFVSTSTICHVFHDKMKISIKQYILKKKIALAATLINEGMSASEAARHVGYENYSNFYNAYKKLFGTTPSGTKRKTK